MLRLVADENFNNDVVRGLLRQQPNLDIVRLQDMGLSGADDLTVLEWAATQGRMVVTHDVTTMTVYAYHRVAAGLSMPGVIAIGTAVAVAQAIDDLLLLAECSEEGEWAGRIVYVPLS